MKNPGHCGNYQNTQLDEMTMNYRTQKPTVRESTPSSYNMRSTLAQCFATSVDSTSLVSIGLLLTVPAIVIASVKNENSDLHMNDSQISWYASLLFISQPFGCFLGGFLQNYIGRKHGLLIMHISCALTWFVLFKASNVEMLYMSAILAGASIGFSESPGLTYVCEITTPKLRGIMVTFNTNCIGIGLMTMFLMCTFISWKTSCLVCMGWSLSSILLLVFIPDSPIWLLNKGRTEEARKALQWLRGWVPESTVEPELEDLRHFIKISNLNNGVTGDDGANTFWDLHCRAWKLLLKRETLRPFALILIIGFFAVHSSLTPARSYFQVVLDNLKLPLNSRLIGFLHSLSALLGGFVSIAAVRMFGKRKLALTSIALISLLSLSMSVYIMFQDVVRNRWIFIILYVLQAFAQISINGTPWILLGEVYPIATRSIASGMTAAALYFLLSVYVKIFYYLQHLTSTEDTFALYSCFGFVGFIYLWIFMPETEGKTMAEIQELFADDARKSCPHFQQNK